MIKVELKHNPYTVKTEVYSDGELLRPGTLMDKIGTVRLQEWIEDFPRDIAEELQSDDYELTFYGTDLDYDDVEYAFKHDERYMNIPLNYVKSSITEENKIKK